MGLLDSLLQESGNNVTDMKLAAVICIGLPLAMEGSQAEFVSRCRQLRLDFEACAKQAHRDYSQAVVAGDDGREAFSARKACNYITQSLDVCGNMLIGECNTEEKVLEMKDNQLENFLRKLNENLDDWESEKCPTVKAYLERKRAREGGDDVIAPQEHNPPVAESESEPEPEEAGQAVTIEEQMSSLRNETQLKKEKLTHLEAFFEQLERRILRLEEANNVGYLRVHDTEDTEPGVMVVEVGQSVTLVCDHTLEEDTLYSLKWYMNGMEFFRYIPSESPQVAVFDFPMFVVSNSSLPTRLVLRNISLESGGGYFRCEISSDAPEFETDSGVMVIQTVEVAESVLESMTSPAPETTTNLPCCHKIKLKSRKTSSLHHPFIGVYDIINDYDNISNMEFYYVKFSEEGEIILRNNCHENELTGFYSEAEFRDCRLAKFKIVSGFTDSCITGPKLYSGLWYDKGQDIWEEDDSLTIVCVD